MVYLLIAIVCGVTINIAFAYAGKKQLDTLNITLINYIVACITAGFGLRTSIAANHSVTLSTSTLVLAVVAGAFYLAGFIFIQKSVLKNGPSSTSLFNKLSMIVPILFSVIVFKDSVNALRWVGIVVALVSLALYVYDGKRFKPDPLLFGVFLMVAVCDLTSVLFVKLCPASEKSLFMAITFGVAGIICLLMLLKRRGPKLKPLECILGLVIGFVNMNSTNFTMSALNTIPSAIVYPVLSVAVILLTAVLGMAFFGEKFNKNQKIAMGIAIVALVILNI